METVFHQVTSRDFMPHGHCYFWEPYILWSHAISDGIIALAYCAIPLTLIYIFRKRQDFKFIWVMVLFAVFIFGCGITHVFDVVTIWNPIYRADSVARIITALASIGTAVVLVKITPNILSIPTAAQWLRVNQELQAQVLTLQEKDRTIEAFREFEALTETLPQLVWTNLADGSARFFNQRWYQYTGLPFEGSLEGALEKAVLPRQMPAALAAWREALAGQQPFEQELCLRNAGGHYRWHLARALPVRTAALPGLWVCTLTDIHDQKLQHTVLEQKNRELVRINTDLDNFIYTASHDLKGPVANIEGLAGQLHKRLGKRVGETEEMLLSLLDQSALKLKHTIDDLTEIAKVQKNMEEEAGVQVFETVLAEVQQDLTPAIVHSGAVITTDFTVPEIQFQKKNLRSIFYNLLTNAIKYQRPGVPPVVEVRTRPEGEYILLTVRDNGLGIREAHKEKLFRMFRRFHTHVEGTGIGLYIVKRIVENNGGYIEVESEEGKGSTFSVYFKNE
jgi:signal transduction histidine kinase